MIVTVAAGSPSQIVVVPLITAVGIGLTVIVNDSGAPVHPFAVGVYVIVATSTAAPAVGANDAMFPVPLAPNPIDMLSFVQSNVVPGTAPVGTTAVDGSPAHNT